MRMGSQFQLHLHASIVSADHQDLPVPLLPVSIVPDVKHWLSQGPLNVVRNINAVSEWLYF